MAVILNELADKRFHVYDIHELYFGTPPTQEVYRPRVGDMVIDRTIGMYFVSAVNVQGIPTLELVSRFSQQSTFNLDSTSLITALSYYQPSGVTRAFFSNATSPYTVAIDSRYRCFGSESVKMIFFLGSDISATGTMISEIRNSSGTVTGNAVTLEEVTTGINTVKRPPAFQTSRLLKSGEVITGVAYTATGGVFSTQPFLITESSAVRSATGTAKFLQSISLKSDLISPTDAKLIENRIGTPFSTALLKGVLHYSNGDKTEVNIDGSKMVLQGVDDFDTSRVGRPSNVVLTYYPGANEPFVNGGVGSKSHLSEIYKLSNIAPNTAYKLKVFCVPTFVDAATGYTFKWFLVNLKGDLALDVTQHIGVYQPDGTAIRPTDYGTQQDLSVSVTMNTVAPNTYPGHVHTQKIELTVSVPGTTGHEPWKIDYIGDGQNVYGLGLTASSNAAGDAVNVSVGAKTQSAFLDKLYYPAEPMYDPTVQTLAPAPTHFVIMHKGKETAKLPISSWGTNIPKPATMDRIVAKSTITVRWILQTVNGDQVLAYSPLLVKLDL